MFLYQHESIIGLLEYTRGVVLKHRSHQPAGNIGIFWLYKHEGQYQVIGLADPVDIGQAHASCLDHPATHIESWPLVKCRYRSCCPGIEWLDEYDEIPRGRVVFHQRGGFIVYMGQGLIHNVELQRMILKFFSIETDAVKFKQDDHYTTGGDLSVLFDRSD